MKSWKHLAAAAAAMAMLTGMTACGGGGDDSGGSAGPGALGGLERIEASQQAAEDLVDEVNELVLELRSAEESGVMPNPMGVQVDALPTGATINETFPCSGIGTSGSGTMRVVMVTDRDKPVSTTIEYNDCTYTTEGHTYWMDGESSTIFHSWKNENDWSFTTHYDIDYMYTGPSYSDSYRVVARQYCEYSNGILTCEQLSSTGAYQLSSWSISATGEVITVSSATVVGKSVTVEFSDWTYDSATGRATSGTVTVTDSNGNTAVLTATGTGYTVVTTVDGVTSTWTVTYS